MTDQQHPITPPPELVKKWADSRLHNSPQDLWRYIALLAAQWGADQELEACCEVLHQHDRAYLLPSQLRTVRRPKPPSLSRVALLQLDVLSADLGMNGAPVDFSQIRRALERLQQLEDQQ